MYTQLNRLLVGTDLFSLNMELKQDGRTVSCNHTDVRGGGTMGHIIA